MTNKDKENQQEKPKKIKQFKKEFRMKIKKKNTKPLIALFLLSVFLALVFPYLTNSIKYIDSEVALTAMEKKFWEWIYKEVFIDWNKAIATLTWETEKEWGVEKIKRDIAILPDEYTPTELSYRNPTIITDIKVKDKTSEEFWNDMFPTILAFILFFIIAIFLISRMWGMANNAMTFWKSRAKLYDKNDEKVLFKDVAWADEEKEELHEIVDFLKNPKKYKKIWAKIPRGTLLVWPPWTGKTLLARAVAWESWVPFLSISGSEFVEMFVWVWASRVRDLFANAKKIAPAIIFMDEIDAIWKKRGPWLGWGHDEREQTLNQILTEMDGFDNDTNVIVMWATNRSDVLDSALLRPGRFDRKITVNLPNLKDREEILKIHARDKDVEDNIDFKALASSTVWFSGADLWNLMNEAAIITARHNEQTVSEKRIQEAFERIVMWLRKKSLVMDKHEKEVTAYHEVWHALVWKLLPHTDPVHKVSIISRGWALWVTWFLPERDQLLTSKAKFLDELATLYGWRVAEEVFFGKENITTWASNDIERATTIARNMVTKYGMYEDIWAENFIWDDVSWNHLGVSWENKDISNKTKEKIDEKVKEVLNWAYKTAIKLVQDHKELHEKIAKDLIEKEEISREDFEEYFSKKSEKE